MSGLSECCKDALKLAAVKNLGAGEGFSSKIPGFAGLVVFAPTRAEVMTELKSALEGWIELSLERGTDLPALHDLEALPDLPKAHLLSNIGLGLLAADCPTVKEIEHGKTLAY